MYAYFAPYPRVRRQALIAQSLITGRARADRLGQSVNGEAMHLLTLGQGERKLWVVAHQHPGETMGAWFMEGLVLRLLDEEDDVANDLLERATIHLIPSMNPDGHYLGNHRTNAAGLDLNRSWFDASPTEAPEVFAVRKAMYDRGCDFFLDVHGDEHTPYVFLAGAEGNPHYNDRIEALEEYFENAMLDASGDFQTEEGYPKDAPGKGDLRCAGNYVGEAFDCLSMTLEMPFKDNADAPDEERGWSPDRCRYLAASTLEALQGTVEALRD
jgi:murein tripeptide amidase MpaA